jgi:site-specific recombinase XerD
VRSYAYRLIGEFKKQHDNRYPKSLSELVDYFRDNYELVLTKLEHLDSAQRKTVLASLLTISPLESKAYEIYQKLMKMDMDKYRKWQESQVKSEKEKKNWISADQVREVWKMLEQRVQRFLKSPTKLPLYKDDFFDLQDFVILSVYTLIEPRRIADYAYFKIRNVNEKEDNFMELPKNKKNKAKFVFNRYKTEKYYGRQEVEIPNTLKTIIQKWMMYNPTDWLFVNIRHEKILASNLTSKINSIFQRALGNPEIKISVNMLRHIMVSDESLKDAPLLEKMKQTAKEMGTSVESLMLYKKE